MIFLNNCVNWPREQLDLLDEIVEEAEKISFDNFVRNVGRDVVRPFAVEEFGYSSVEAMRHDWAIGFYRTTICGKTYYYIEWSAIEYVFTEDGEY